IRIRPASPQVEKRVDSEGRTRESEWIWTRAGLDSPSTVALSPPVSILFGLSLDRRHTQYRARLPQRGFDAIDQVTDRPHGPGEVIIELPDALEIDLTERKAPV